MQLRLGVFPVEEALAFVFEVFLLLLSDGQHVPQKDVQDVVVEAIV